MDVWLRERIRERFPEAEELAFKRLYGTGAVLLDRKHKPKYPKDLIAVVIHMAQGWAFEAGFSLGLNKYEKAIAGKHFIIEKVLVWLSSAVLLLSSLSDAWQ